MTAPPPGRGPGPVQSRLPGLLGMAVLTDCVYLRALHGHANALRGSAVNSLRVHMFSVDFARLVALVRNGDWSAAEDVVVEGLAHLQRAGAAFGVVTANTGAALTETAAARIQLPLLDITDVTCRAARGTGVQRLGLLGTARTIESGVYGRAGARAGIEVVVPSPAISAAVDKLIFEELISGLPSPQGVAMVRDAVEWFRRQGAQGVALACTDLTHMHEELRGTASLPVFDTTTLHARAAAETALGGVFPWTPRP